MKVPVYDNSTVAPTNEPTPYQNLQVSPNAFGAQIGEAQQNAGKAGMQDAEQQSQVILKRQDYINQTMAKEGMNNYVDARGAALYTGPDAFYAKQGKDAALALPDAMKKADEDYQAALDKMPNPAAKSMFAETASRYNTMFRQGMNEHVFQQTNKWQDQTDLAYNDNLGQSASLNYNNPKFIASAASAVGQNTDQMSKRNGIDPSSPLGIDNRQKALDLFGKKFGTAVLDRDPASLKSMLQDDNGPLKDVSPETKDYLQYRADERLKSLMSTGRAAVTNEFKQAEAIVVDHGQYPNEDSLMKNIDTHFDPEVADTMRAEYTDYKHLYNFKQQMAFSKPEDDLSLVTKMKPDVSSPDYIKEQRLYEIADAAAKQKQEMIDNDPAGYITKQSPETAQAFTAAMKGGPAQFSDYTAKLNSLYSQMGLHSFQRSVLPAEVAKGMVNDIVHTQPDQVKGKLDQMQAHFGNDGFHQVMGDLVKNKLPLGYSVLAAVDDPRAQQAISQGLSAGEKTARSAIPETTAKEIDQKIDTDVNLQRLFAAKKASGDDGSLAEAIKSTMKIGAYNLAATPNMATGAAVKLMSNSITTSKYDFSVDNTVVPKGMDDAVQKYTHAAIANLKAADLATYVAGPTPRTQDQNRPAETDEQRLQSVKDGKWITRADDNGLLRVDRAAVPVKHKDGSFMEMDFNDMKYYVPLLPGNTAGPQTKADDAKSKEIQEMENNEH